MPLPSCLCLSSEVERRLLNPLIVFCITVLVRCLLFDQRYNMELYVSSPIISHPMLSDVIPPSSVPPHDSLVGRAAPDRGASTGAFVTHDYHERFVAPPASHFMLWGPSDEMATWREVVYWRDRGYGNGTMPYYLKALAPWYASFIPSILASPQCAILVLSCMDGATAVVLSQWSSSRAALTYGFLVLNPALILPTVHLSLCSFNLFLLTMGLQCFRYRRHSPFALPAAFGFIAFLGSPFLAVLVTMMVPVGAQSKLLSFASAAALICFVGVYTTIYAAWIKDTEHYSSLYSPPDVGVQWYVRQLVLAVFSRSLEFLMMQLPCMLIIPAAISLPVCYATQTAVEAMESAAATSVKPKSKQPALPVHERIFEDGHLFILINAVGLAILFRTQLTLSYWFIVPVYIYSSLNPRANKRCILDDGSPIVYTPHLRVRLLMPIFTVLTSNLLQFSFYSGWVLRDSANANWKFFSDIGFVVGSLSFITLWFGEGVEDAMRYEMKLRDATGRAAVPTEKVEAS